MGYPVLPWLASWLPHWMRLPRTRREGLVVGGVGLATVVTLVLVQVQGTPAMTPRPGEVELARAGGTSCGYLDAPRRDLRVMFVGDSMTQGRSGSATFRYWVWRGLAEERDDVAFVGPTTELNGSADPAAYEHRDAGFDRQLRHAARARSTFASIRELYPLRGLVRRQRPDVVVLQLGFNDSNTRRSTPRDLADLSAAYMRDVWAIDGDLGRPRTRFVLGQIPPATLKAPGDSITRDRNRRTQAANDLVREQWRSQPCLVQVNRLRSGASPAWDPRAHTYDGAHPDATGETLMAQRMLASMRRLGMMRGDVDVYDPTERWAPRPRALARVLPDGRVRVSWVGERDRVSATDVRLVVDSGGEPRLTRWYDGDSAVLDLGRGEHEIRAVVRRGLPGRMISDPGPAAVVDVG